MCVTSLVTASKERQTGAKSCKAGDFVKDEDGKIGIVILTLRDDPDLIIVTWTGPPAIHQDEFFICRLLPRRSPLPPPRLGHSPASISIVQRLEQLTLWFWPHILAFGRAQILGLPRSYFGFRPMRSSIYDGRHANRALGGAEPRPAVAARGQGIGLGEVLE